MAARAELLHYVGSRQEDYAMPDPGEQPKYLIARYVIGVVVLLLGSAAALLLIGWLFARLFGMAPSGG